ncbi:MAG: TetR/AcrR family transcriptional regulator [Leadbetterella sp.]
MHNNFYLKNPIDTDLGIQIVQKGIDILNELGYEKFTFKKLACDIPTTEASIYRYFENKHRFLSYLLDYYWQSLIVRIQDSCFTEAKAENAIPQIVKILLTAGEVSPSSGFNAQKLFYIMLEEGTKSYHTKDIDELNKVHLYESYKQLAEKIAEVFITINPAYKHARSLASSLLEISYTQYYFMNHLPRLSSFSKDKNIEELMDYICDFVKKSLS